MPDMATTVHIFLDESQKGLIQNSWRDLEVEFDNVGTLVFLRIFNQNPDLKALFPFQNNWGNDLVSHPSFKSHSYR